MIAAPGANARASAVIQSTTANSSFVITAKEEGEKFNDVEIVFNDSTDNTVIFDPEGKTLTFNVDLTGGVTANDLQTLVNNDSYASKFFDFQDRKSVV